jgi:hypothetical protein
MGNCEFKTKETKMTREEHLAWCKIRAHEYLDRGDVTNAVASMMSDMQEHPETKVTSPTLQMLGFLAAQSGRVEDARRYIDGFN